MISKADHGFFVSLRADLTLAREQLINDHREDSLSFDIVERMLRLLNSHVGLLTLGGDSNE